MTNSSQLETWSNDLAIAAKTLSDHCRADSSASTPYPAFTNDAPDEADGARRNILTIATRLQTLLAEPAEFIRHLASQNQILACLKWLGEFQVLACIPLGGSIPAKEVADLAGVPETQLCRVVRMTAIAGFLHEPRPGHIAHTALSAPFVTNLSFLDTTMFLAEIAAPTALHMATATQRHGHLESPSDKAAMALAKTYPALHFIVQMIEPAQNNNGTDGAGKADDFNGRITVQKRVPAAVQVIKDAAVYMLRLTTPSLFLPTNILGELSAHLGVLRTNTSATLILAPPLLPEPGTVDPDVEAMARLRDLSRLQLTNECGLELDELIEMVNSVHDSRGRLVVAHKLRSPNSATVALGVKYEAYADGRSYTVEPAVL
ncbi:MAG: hypothetical protein Q9161_007553 [Pseudevernia consocians]